MQLLKSITFVLIIIASCLYVKVLGEDVQNEDVTNDDTVVLVHVLFRHGDRTPLQNEIYPNDPHANHVYANGYGRLTQKGKQKEYIIGKTLRNKYDNLLGEFDEDILFARSTNYNRTKISMQLVLAGLFPPSESQIIEEGLNWQPILFHYENEQNDFLLEDPYYNCPNYIQQYEDYVNSSQQLYVEKYKELYDYISRHTGLDVKTPRQVYNMYFALASEENHGLEHPDWIKSHWPTNITVAASEQYYVTLATPYLRRTAGGELLQKIVSDSREKINNPQQKKKIYLYSAHENNLANQLILLNTFFPHVPPFGSYLIYELHNVNGVYGFKLLYQDYTNGGKLKVLKLPQCDIFCPIDQFQKLVEDHFPIPEDTCILKET